MRPLAFEIKLVNGGRKAVLGIAVGDWLGAHADGDGWVLTHVPTGVEVLRDANRERLLEIGAAIEAHCGARLALDSVEGLRRNGALGRIETVLREFGFC